MAIKRSFENEHSEWEKSSTQANTRYNKLNKIPEGSRALSGILDSAGGGLDKQENHIKEAIQKLEDIVRDFKSKESLLKKSKDEKDLEIVLSLKNDLKDLNTRYLSVEKIKSIDIMTVEDQYKMYKTILPTVSLV